MSEFWIDRIKGLMDLSTDQLAESRRRFESLYGDWVVDYLPVIILADVPEQENYPKFDMREAFFEPDKMACNQFWGALAAVRSGSDAMPTIRVNTGVGTVISAFGLEQDILPDAMPWPQQHLDKATISQLEPVENVEDVPLMQHARTVIEFYKEHLPELPIYVFDTQSPFDLAHLIAGDEIFYEIHDDPPFVEHLMELATSAYAACTRYCKQLIGEPLDRAYHSMCYFQAAGIRLCEDTTTLINHDATQRYMLPYSNRMAEQFGGAFVHYCGKHDHMLTAFIEQMPQCRYLNFGNPEMHDFEQIMPRLLNAGRTYIGSIPRQENELLETYLRRCLGYLQGIRKGLVLFPDLNESERSRTLEVVDLYRQLQDDMLN